MQSALRALRGTVALGNVSCPRQQFNQDNRLYCPLQLAFPNILFRLLNCVVVSAFFVFSQRSWRKTAVRKTVAIRQTLCTIKTAQKDSADQVQPLPLGNNSA